MWKLLKFAASSIIAAKWYIISAFVASTLAGYAIHTSNDAKRKADLRQAQGRIEVLEIDNIAKGDEIAQLNQRIKATNDRLLAEVAKERERVLKSETNAAILRAEINRTSSALATAKRNLLEARTSDLTLQTWAAEPVPAGTADRVRESAGN